MFSNMDITNIRTSITQFKDSLLNAFDFQRRDTFVQEYGDMDVEMNVLGAHTIDLVPNGTDQTDHPSLLPCVSALLLCARHQAQRLRSWLNLGNTASNMTEFQYNVSVTAFILLCCVLWARAGYPAARYVFPFHKTTGELWKDNYHRLSAMWPEFQPVQPSTRAKFTWPSETQHNHMKTQTIVINEDEGKTFVLIITASARTVTTTIKTPTLVPGFYFYPTISILSDDVWKVTTSSSFSATTQETQFPQSTAINEKSQSQAPIHKDVIKTDTAATFYHALGAHDGGSIQFMDNSYAMPMLEACASGLLKNIEDYGVKATDALVHALDSCKVLTEDALASPTLSSSAPTAYQGTVKHNQVMHDFKLNSVDVSQAALEEACESYKGPPISNPTKWTATHCTWRYPAGFNNRICSDTFCDQFVGSRFHKCFRTSNISTIQCQDKFVLEDANDYREDAAYECEFCLPSIDCQGIETHCQKVQNSEAHQMKVLLIGFALVVAAATIAVWINIWIQARRRNKLLTTLRDKQFDDRDIDYIDQEALVVPAATGDQYPSVVRHSGSNASQD